MLFSLPQTIESKLFILKVSIGYQQRKFSVVEEAGAVVGGWFGEVGLYVAKESFVIIVTGI